ncbi:MAG: hypothetical protein GVY24_07360, partial [Planctomycetes bacterium]|nr:hypothetical protein [Planctomycetota bacterium]
FQTPDGSTANVKQRIAFPDPHASDKDFALFELDAPITTATAVGLYQGAPATLAGETAVYAGSGFTGDGDQGETGPRKILAGTNRINLVVNGNSARSNFDDPNDPSATLTDLETALMRKDSGGGLYVASGDTYLLAGVHTFVDHARDRSIGQYGQGNISTVLTDDVRDWIAATTMPEPSSLGILLSGGGVALQRRPRKGRRQKVQFARHKVQVRTSDARASGLRPSSLSREASSRTRNPGPGTGARRAARCPGRPPTGTRGPA